MDSYSGPGRSEGGWKDLCQLCWEYLRKSMFCVRKPVDLDTCELVHPDSRHIRYVGSRVYWKPAEPLLVFVQCLIILN